MTSTFTETFDAALWHQATVDTSEQRSRVQGFFHRIDQHGTEPCDQHIGRDFNFKSDVFLKIESKASDYDASHEALSKAISLRQIEIVFACYKALLAKKSRADA